MEGQTEIRFLDFFSRGNRNACWEWNGATDKGYGRFWDGKKVDYAHRTSYEYFRGKIGKGLTVDHICRNRKCVNPEHLRLLTAVENIMCGQSLPAINKAKTKCLNGHPFDEENTRTPKSGGRVCKTCKRIWDSQYRRKRKESDPCYHTKYIKRWREKRRQQGLPYQ